MVGAALGGSLGREGAASPRTGEQFLRLALQSFIQVAHAEPCGGHTGRATGVGWGGRWAVLSEGIREGFLEEVTFELGLEG